jgi:hypothetical protein
MRWERLGRKVALDVALGINYLHTRYATACFLLLSLACCCSSVPMAPCCNEWDQQMRPLCLSLMTCRLCHPALTRVTLQLSCERTSTRETSMAFGVQAAPHDAQGPEVPQCAAE